MTSDYLKPEPPPRKRKRHAQLNKWWKKKAMRLKK